MVSGISPATSAPTTAGGTRKHAPANLEAQLNTCRAQLEDWTTCPSAKTPEGKAKIKEITTRFDAIKGQIDKADQVAERQKAARAASAQRMDAVASVDTTAPAGRATVDGPLGQNLDVYA